MATTTTTKSGEGAIPAEIRSRTEFKRKFGLGEMYDAAVFVPRAMSELIRNRRVGVVDPQLVERLQLAVTEVNGCAACSYQHAKMALREGMSNEEIFSLLSGGDEFIEPDEATAILFAQHFADARGVPERYAYDAIVEEYGSREARVILAAVQVIIAGNIYGIPLSALQSRIAGKPYTDSSLSYEGGMLLAGLLLAPSAILHGVLRGVFGLPNERFNDD